MWATRLVSEWASYETPAAIIAHGANEAVHFRGGEQLAVRWPLIDQLSREAALLAGPELPSLASCDARELSRILPTYIAAFEGMLAACDRLLVVPTLAGDCTGLCVAAARALQQRDAAMGERVRIAGWLHSAFAYDLAVISHYEQGLDVLAAVSEHLVASLCERFPHRSAHIIHTPSGVLASEDPAPAISKDDQTLRLLYVGRLEDDVKRVGLLPLLSRQLSAMGVLHTLTIVGDGPAEAMLREAGVPQVKMLGPLPQHAVREQLAAHDCLLLMSRSEGLSLSMLEAMACGCCPVVTHTPSGASEALTHQVTGLLVPVEGITDRSQIAHAFASLLAQTPRSQLRAMGERARRTAKVKFSVKQQIAKLESVIETAFAQPAKTWRAKEFAFSSKPSVGPEAERRVRALIDAHPDSKFVVHGTGKHTRELEHIWTSVLPQLVAFAEDDTTQAGKSLLGKPIVTPECAAAAGATHVIISSHLNQHDIWQRRDVYEKQGLKVLRIYE